MRKVVAILSIFISFSPAFALDHVCKNSKVLGRTNYACQAVEEIFNNTNLINEGLAAIEQTNMKAIQKGCKTTCKTSCQSDATKDNDPDFKLKTCVLDCFDSCQKTELSKVTEKTAAGIGNYISECKKSMGGKDCEQLEARAYCDIEVNPEIGSGEIKTAADFGELKRNFKRMKKVYEKRRKDLNTELNDVSAKLVTDVNTKLSCNILAADTDICEQDRKIVKATVSLDEFTKAFVQKKEKENPAELIACKPQPTPLPTPKIVPGQCVFEPPYKVYSDSTTIGVCKAPHPRAPGYFFEGWAFKGTCCAFARPLTSTTSSSEDFTCCVQM